MGSLSPVHWLIVLVVVLLLFGSRKLPDMARGLGQSMRIFQAETRAMRDDHSHGDDSERTSSGPSAVSSGSSSATGSSGGTASSSSSGSAESTSGRPTGTEREAS